MYGGPRRDATYFCLCASTVFIPDFVCKIGYIDCVHGARMNTLYIICKLLYSLGQGTDYAGHPDERLLTDSYKMQVWGEGKGLQTV